MQKNIAKNDNYFDPSLSVDMVLVLLRSTCFMKCLRNTCFRMKFIYSYDNAKINSNFTVSMYILQLFTTLKLFFLPWIYIYSYTTIGNEKKMCVLWLLNSYLQPNERKRQQKQYVNVRNVRLFHFDLLNSIQTQFEYLKTSFYLIWKLSKF